MVTGIVFTHQIHSHSSSFLKLSFLEIVACFTNYWILVYLISHEFHGTDLVSFRSSILYWVAFLALGISIDIPSPISLAWTGLWMMPNALILLGSHAFCLSLHSFIVILCFWNTIRFKWEYFLESSKNSVTYPFCGCPCLNYLGLFSVAFLFSCLRL